MPIAGAPTEAGTYTVAASFPGSADYTSASTPPVPFTIAPAPTAVSLDASAASVAFGQSVGLTAAVTLNQPDEGAPTGTVTFLDGKVPLGVASLDATGRAVLAVSGLGPGVHSITAVYGGDGDRSGSQSEVVTESVTPAGTQIILVPHAVLRGKKIAALSLAAGVEPLTSGGESPTGIVTFMLKKKTLGRAALDGGRATLAVRPGVVLNGRITVIYGGAAGFLGSSATTPPLTSRSLVSAERGLG
jgi:hypothetical protein